MGILKIKQNELRFITSRPKAYPQKVKTGHKARLYMLKRLN
ncbi:hypothetical protein XBKQ1_760065 [Xenorhabdus bovienii str. kraussei Quebec]|uniref:Uncharacterized protein n=2 Tax=Xenorhabdus bovienii TaxID=40576 RepID=A0A077PMN4_XENBV|nr:hypothetical protein XBKQ1_760065 [Xenorhabdus bovienii str. kraussei Quebec]CDH31557.1 hypothetical protein XBI1_1570031 [Xenorhabdus bovienii str. Intermedium]